MHIGLYGRPDNPYMAAVMEGTKALGHRHEWRRPGVFTADQREPFDLVAVYGLQGAERRVRDVYRSAGVPVVVADHLYCGDDVARVGVWLDEMSWLPREPVAGRNPFRLQPRRRDGGGRVLACGQKPGDAQHDLDGPGMVRWARETVWRLRQFTDRPIWWRPHPAAGAFEVAGAALDRCASIEEAIEDAFCLVTYNSTAGIKALAAGVPVLCAPCATYAEVASVELAAVADPHFPTDAERAAWFDRLGGVLWTVEEMRDGSCLRFMIEEEGVRHVAA